MVLLILLATDAVVAQIIPSPEPPPVVNCDNCLVLQESALWQIRNVDVCWEPEDVPVAQVDKQLVQNAIARSWGAVGILNFVGWQDCPRLSNGLRISVRNSYTTPRALNYGQYLAGQPDGLQMNFDLYNTGQWNCCYNRRAWCIEVQAIHEFGHAIGFHHEQRRSDIAEVAPDCAKDHPNEFKIQDELLLTEYDANSVMNYCNRSWAGNGRLVVSRRWWKFEGGVISG